MTLVDNMMLRAVFNAERGFPAAAFIDAGFYDFEVSEVLHKDWACVAFEHDVAGPGDLFPVTFAAVPLMVARDAAGVVRVFHNVCSHRGSMLIDEAQCSMARITCPYHRWTYALDGALTHTAHVGGFRVHVTPEADPSELGLREVRSAVWNGFVFVDVGGNAAPFDEFIAPAAARVAAVDFTLLRHDAEFDAEFDIDANWKVLIENYVESYHVPMVHPELQKFNPMSAHYQILGGRSYAGQGGLAYGDATNPAPMPGADLPMMDTLLTQEYSYESLILFPNLFLTPTPNATFAIILLPQSAGRTVERVAFFFNGDESLAVHHHASRSEVVASIVVVNNEDIGIVESCQRGRHSPAFSGGVFMTNQESTSMLVQQVIAGHLLERCGESVDYSTLAVRNIFHELATATSKHEGEQ